MKPTKLLFLFYLILLFPSCTQDELKTKKISFYHWKTFPDNIEELLHYTEKGAIEKIYYRLFDLKMEGQKIIPVAQAQIDSLLIGEKNLATCIFISNDCFSDDYSNEVKNTAQKSLRKIKSILEDYGLEDQWDELQIDCDWTLSTKKNYFDYLNQLRASLPPHIRLSATIRLHQIKFPEKTGIPPVDKGSLMCYNMDDIADIQSPNSIFSRQILQSYLNQKSSYPLKLDIALPVFEWHLVFRDDKLHKIISQNTGDISRLRSIAENIYEVDKDQYIAGHYLYKGDLIKREGVNVEDLRSALAIIEQSELQIADNIVFYHLNKKLTTSFPYDTLQQLVLDFR